MAHDPIFDSAWLKWSGAKVHAEALKKDIGAVLAELERQPLFPVARDYDPKRHCIIFRIAHEPPVPARWGLHLGDIINGYRCSLDHLAWALVGRGKHPPTALTESQRRRVYFPIATTLPQFCNQIDWPQRRPGKSMLPGISRADIAIVRRYQPYVAGKRRVGWHSFALLQGLSDNDKHRTVQPVWLLPTGATHRVLSRRDCDITRMPARSRTVPLDVHAELTRVYVRRAGPNPDVDMESQVEANPALNERITVWEWLTKIGGWTSRLLREFSEPPETIFGLGDELLAELWQAAH